MMMVMMVLSTTNILHGWVLDNALATYSLLPCLLLLRCMQIRILLLQQLQHSAGSRKEKESFNASSKVKVSP
jgi:hypothetical protein